MAEKKLVNHVNLTDSKGRVYCRMLKKIVELDSYHQRDYCSNCSFFRGTAQGEGVECEWEDIRDNVDTVHVVSRPEIEEANIMSAEAKYNNKQ